MPNSMPFRLHVTVRTQQVFGIAHDLADRLGHGEVTPVHIFLAMLQEGRSPAVSVLHALGVPMDDLAQELEQRLPTPVSPRVGAGEPAWSESDEVVLSQAAVEARELGHPYQGCEHVLLAFLRHSASIPAEVLSRHGVRFANAQAEVLRQLGSPTVR